MIITNNHVLILPEPNFTKDGDFELIDVFEPAKHFSVRGTVVAVPEELNYFGKEVAELMKDHKRNLTAIQEYTRWSMEWDTPLEISVGNEVYFQYMNRIASVEDNKVLGHDELGEQGLLFIEYNDLYMAMSGEDSWMLNGFIFVEAIEYTLEEIKELGGGVFIDTPTLEKPGMGIVRKIGSMNGSYLDGSVEGPKISVGTKVLFRHSNAVPVEYKYHKEINDGKYAYYRMQRKDILAYQ